MTTTWILDLDGVIWCGRRAVLGSAAAVTELRQRGQRIVFATNHSAPTRKQLRQQLDNYGIVVSDDEVRSSADAAAGIVQPGERVNVFAGEGVAEAVTRRGAVVANSGAVDAVIVGWHDNLNFTDLTRAVRDVLGGARLIATNDDPLRPDDDEAVPGAGAFVAAVEAATSVVATRAGKPHQPMADVLQPLLTDDVIVVGDSPLTDGGLATTLGARFALVLSGVTTLPPPHSPHVLVADDLGALVAATFAR